MFVSITTITMARIALASAGACKPKEWEQSVHILRTLMPAADIEPDAQSFEHVAAACEEGHESGQQAFGLYPIIHLMQLICSSENPNFAIDSACVKSCQVLRP
jgi:hypothetical protein